MPLRVPLLRDPRPVPFRVETRRATVLGGTGVLALGLIVLGLYGTVALSVGLRLRELSVRMALGSSRTAIVRLVLRQVLAPVVVGVVFGLVVALGAARVLTALLYGVSPHDPATLAAAALTLLTTTAAAGLSGVARHAHEPHALAPGRRVMESWRHRPVQHVIE